MNKISIAVGVSLLAGFAAAAIVLKTSQPGSKSAESPVPNSYFDASAAIDERIQALEAAVSQERQARQLLEDELLLLFAEIERLEASREQPDEGRDARGSVETGTVTRFEQLRGERATTSRKDGMIVAGLSPDRVDWILQREEEMRFEALQARFEARNSGGPQNPFDPSFNPDAMLRAEIGDAEYEMYLEGSNRQTSVAVSNVLASSPGARAGLQPGDQIVAYDGRRVFSSGDLVQQTMAGGEGNVVVDLTRDGVPLQLVLPRGPIGVEIGQFRRR